MTVYPFSSLPENRHCYGERAVPVEPCHDFPCIHTPCHDPDYLADKEDRLRDSAYHIRLWWEFDLVSNPIRPHPICHKDEETESRKSEQYNLVMQSEEMKQIILEPDSEEAQRYNVSVILAKPLSDEQYRDFESKFERCRRLRAKDRALKRDMRRFSIKRKIEELKRLDDCVNKETRTYKEAAEYRGQILASVAKTGDYLFGWNF